MATSTIQKGVITKQFTINVNSNSGGITNKAWNDLGYSVPSGYEAIAICLHDTKPTGYQWQVIPLVSTDYGVSIRNYYNMTNIPVTVNVTFAKV